MDQSFQEEESSAKDVIFSNASDPATSTVIASEPLTESIQVTQQFENAFSTSTPENTKKKKTKLNFRPEKFIPKRLRHVNVDVSYTNAATLNPLEMKDKKKKPSIVKKFGFGKLSKVGPTNIDVETIIHGNTAREMKDQTNKGVSFRITDSILLNAEEIPEDNITKDNLKLKNIFESERSDTHSAASKKKHNKASGVILQCTSDNQAHKLDQDTENICTTYKFPTVQPLSYTSAPLQNIKPISDEREGKDQITLNDLTEIDTDSSRKTQYNKVVGTIQKETENVSWDCDITPSVAAPAVPYNISELEVTYILDKGSKEKVYNKPRNILALPYSSIEATDSEYKKYIKSDQQLMQAEKELTVLYKADEFMKRSEKLNTSVTKKSDSNSDKARSVSQDNQLQSIENIEVKIPIVEVHPDTIASSYENYSSKESSETFEKSEKPLELKTSDGEINFRIGTLVRPVKTITANTGITDSVSFDDNEYISQQEFSSFSSDSQSPPLSERSRRRIKYEPSTIDEQTLLEPGSFGPPSSFLGDYNIDYSLNSLSMVDTGSNDIHLQNMSPPSEKKEHLYKILVIGELGTGKTSFIKRYVHQFFSQNYRATIGVDFALKVLNWDANTIIRLQLWDIAGQERFGNMTRVYYKEAVGAFIVFDVTRSATFDAVVKWKQDLDSKVQLPDGSPIPCILLANKSDQQKQGIATTPAKLDEYVKEHGFAGWYETSAKENINIDEAAKALVNKILANDKLLNGNEIESDGFAIDGRASNSTSKNSCSC